jgi:hypothetical protein
MDFEKEKSDWQTKPAEKVVAMVTTLDGHIAKCPPKCSNPCDLEHCPLGKGNICMYRHLTDYKVQFQKTPVIEIAQRQIASIEDAKLFDERVKAEELLGLQEQEVIIREKP